MLCRGVRRPQPRPRSSHPGPGGGVEGTVTHGMYLLALGLREVVVDTCAAGDAGRPRGGARVRLTPSAGEAVHRPVYEPARDAVHCLCRGPHRPQERLVKARTVAETLDIAAAVATHVARRPGATAPAWQGDAVTYPGSTRWPPTPGPPPRPGSRPGEPLGAALTRGPAAGRWCSPACVSAGPSCSSRRTRAGHPPALLAAGSVAAAGSPTATLPLEAVPRGGGHRSRGPLAGAAPLGAAADDVGTTGTPKVVPLGGAAVGRFVAWAVDHFGLALARRCSPSAPAVRPQPARRARPLAAAGRSSWSSQARSGRTTSTGCCGHRVEVVVAVPMIYRLLLGSPATAGAPLGTCGT